MSGDTSPEALSSPLRAGEENIDLVESLRQSESIKTITVRHEQAGGFMAATYGRLTGLLLPDSTSSWLVCMIILSRLKAA